MVFGASHRALAAGGIQSDVVIAVKLHDNVMRCSMLTHYKHEILFRNPFCYVLFWLSADRGQSLLRC